MDVACSSACELSLACKACGGDARKLFYNHNEHGSVTPILTCRCQKCGLVFVASRPTHNQLGEAYGTLNTDRYYAEIRETNLAKMRKCAVDLLSLPGIDRQSAVIDLGCGDGEFPLLLQENGFTNLSGHEIPGADLSRMVGMSVFQDYDYETVPAGAFDVVTLLDVAEHVPNPAHLFAACRQMLKPGGWLYFHTPGVSSLDRLMHHLGPLGRKWQRSRTSIFHLQNYSRRSLELLLRDFGNVNIRQVNELTWPISRYVRVYLKPPAGLVKPVAAALWPVLATRLNANKMVVQAQRS